MQSAISRRSPAAPDWSWCCTPSAPRMACYSSLSLVRVSVRSLRGPHVGPTLSSTQTLFCGKQLADVQNGGAFHCPCHTKEHPAIHAIQCYAQQAHFAICAASIGVRAHPLQARTQEGSKCGSAHGLWHTRRGEAGPHVHVRQHEHAPYQSHAHAAHRAWGQSW